MDKNETIKLLEDTHEKLLEFSKMNIGRENKKIIKQYINDIENDLETLNNTKSQENLPTEIIRLKEKYLQLYETLTNEKYSFQKENIKSETEYVPKRLQKEQTDEEESFIKVEKIIPVEDQTDKETKEVNNGMSAWKKILIGVGITSGIIAVILTSKAVIKSLQPTVQPSDDKEKKDNKEIEQVINDLSSIDINDNEALKSYAQKLIEKYKLEYSVDEIIKIIKLANFDQINENVDFTTRESVLQYSEKLGKLLNKTSINELIFENENDDIYISPSQLNDILKNVTNDIIKPESFKVSVNEKGYNIYKVYKICIDNLNNDNKDLAFNYAKIANDILARFTLDFSICPDASIEAYYTIFGMYNANKDIISSLTCGKNLSTIYGSGYQNDDTYGYICAEELIKYAAFDNQDNIFYTAVIDDNILASGISK